VCSLNCLAFPIALLGLAAAGVKATLANASYQPSELAHQITNSGAGLVFVHPALLDTLLKTFASLGLSDAVAQKRVVIMAFTSLEKAMEKQLKIGSQWVRFEEFLKQGKLDKEEIFSGNEVHESIMLCYSSGTTGLSKGVEVRSFSSGTFVSSYWHP
jgi:4-coumarate--CoA ligase